MPELPDVAVFRKYFDATALHQKIASVDLRTDQILQNASPGKLRRWLVGRSFQATEHHGKYLFAQLGHSRWLMLHFGMTGHLKYFKQPQDEPEYTKLLIGFENGYHLALVMPRKLGAVAPIQDPETFGRSKDLGPHVLGDDLDYATFKDLLKGRRGMIKTTLMNQSIVAGIGNVYSDEILFQAGIPPKRPVSDLTEAETERIFKQVRQVLTTAIERKANPDAFPESWLTPHREPGAPCPKCGGDIVRIEVSGRGTYYCPRCQGAVS